MISQWFKDALFGLTLMGLYVMMWILYYLDLINSFVFITFLLLLFLFFVGLYFIYRKEKKVVRKYVFSIVLVTLILIYEYRLIYFEPFTFIVNSVAEPIEAVEGSGIHILTVRSFEVPYIEDENLIIETYERQFQPVISLEKSPIWIATVVKIRN
ncbi:hypothetical protein [Ornithinibacillus halotolerans]|uniref:Uncharacterized protein n=1 Tax=Ornithinibacillus halotolerans TaxID=1274357 RepID=A0A916WEC1_9BACI|nr:hypothetical protein [Ornithinibacillus halotolerans]GGA90611.1 hypothetical protein GCM10008025_36440 [Ornithinibacillus halotolerans]